MKILIGVGLFVAGLIVGIGVTSLFTSIFSGDSPSYDEE